MKSIDEEETKYKNWVVSLGLKSNLDFDLKEESKKLLLIEILNTLNSKCVVWKMIE